METNTAELLTQLENIREKISSDEYKKLIETLGERHKIPSDVLYNVTYIETNVTRDYCDHVCEVYNRINKTIKKGIFKLELGDYLSSRITFLEIIEWINGFEAHNENVVIEGSVIKIGNGRLNDRCVADYEGKDEKEDGGGIGNIKYYDYFILNITPLEI